ncbi:hypothetical protein [Clostridium hydrogenum]|uniref:hypothetical protein n=1 Tax=Clostridium hydrogenum TaxID=2855764 RepID=UPI001F2D88D5|nr:hypothetical protein [Clostridium hydrogenum]
MDSDFKEFTSKKKYILPLIDVLCAIAIFAPFAENRKKHPTAFWIFLVIAIIFIIYVIAEDIYKYYVSEVKRVPDISINNEMIVIRSGFPIKKSILKIDDIEKIGVPKYDDSIEISLKNGLKANINFKGYSKEDITEIKSIFTEIKNKISGEDNNEIKTKTYHNFIGKTYVK